MANIMEQIIVVLQAENPKRPGSKARARYDLYKSGMTRQAALTAGITGGDLRWDTKHGFIKLVSAKQWEAEKKRKTGRKQVTKKQLETAKTVEVKKEDHEPLVRNMPTLNTDAPLNTPVGSAAA